mmetsp:Transcript_12803/g.44505  ORF Transcript_12803/g.44505 Transcript_12803/m.44505 type:complete len:371 (+) Transcript_12803:1817-2929(+)
MQVELLRRLILDRHERLPTGDRRPAVDGQRHDALVLGLHAPLEDPEGGARGEWSVGVLEAQDALVGVQRLIDVGVRLELEAPHVASPDRYAHVRVILAGHGQQHGALHLEVVHAAVLPQLAHQLLLDGHANGVLGHSGSRRGRRPRAWSRPRLVHQLTLSLQRLQEAARLRLAPQHHALLRASLGLGGVCPARHAPEAAPTAEAALHHAAAVAASHPVVKAAAAHATTAKAATATHTHPGRAVVVDQPTAEALQRVAHPDEAALALLHLVLVDLPRLLLHDVLRVVDLALDDHLVELLLVGLHLDVRADLLQGHIFLVPEADDLVEREDQLKGVAAHRLLVSSAGVVGHHLAQEPERLQVLQDVRRLVCD